MISKKYFAGVLAFVIAFTVQIDSLLAQPGQGPSAVVAGKVIELRRAGSESFVGTLQPLRKSIVGTAVDGRVISIDLKPGDAVTAAVNESSANEESANEESASEEFLGQPIMQLRTGTLDIEIGAAEIQLKLAEQALKELQVALPKEIELADANAKVANAGLQYSKTNYERARKLGGINGAISQGELEQALSQFLASEESANAARITLDKLVATQELQLIQSRLRVDSSRQEVARLADLKDKYTIRAPFEGLITQKLTDIGEWVTKGQPIVEIVQLNPIEMIINVPQEHLQRLQQSLGVSTVEKPLTATIKIEGYETPMTGEVKRIVSQADLRSRTFPVRIEIDNPVIGNGYALQPGMLGRATLEIGHEQDMMMLKKDALVLAGDKATVFKIVTKEDDVVVVEVSVEIGVSFGDWIQIKGDLLPGDQIVLLGNERLRRGQAVKVTKILDDRPE